MRIKQVFIFLLVIRITFQFSYQSTRAQTLLQVCGNPTAPCKSKHKEFAPYELSLVLPARIKTNSGYKSEVFFAVILKDKIPVTETEECDGGEFHTKIENERKKVQTLFPKHKVFAGYQCPDMAAIGYLINGQPHNENFLAVYGGATIEDANIVLFAAQGRYPKAAIKKMQAVFEHIVQ